MTAKSSRGSGATVDPIIVVFGPNDKEDPRSMPKWRKWASAMVTCLATFANAFSTSVYTGSIDGVANEFHVSAEVSILGISLFVLGLAIG